MPTEPDLGNASGGMMKYTLQDIAEIGIFIGLALVLNIPIFSLHIMPGAGSISFSMIPLFVIALRKSWWKTLLATSLIYGLISCAMDGYGFHTYPLDYLLGYGSISIVSLFRALILNKGKVGLIYLVASIVIATLIRLLFSTLSGVVNYQMNFLASFTYNGVYISLTGVVNLLALLLLFKPLKIINKRYPSTKDIQ